MAQAFCIQRTYERKAHEGNQAGLEDGEIWDMERRDARLRAAKGLEERETKLD